jgi:hypothetical protein
LETAKTTALFITKLAAAERQLNAAVRMMLADEDELAVLLRRLGIASCGKLKKRAVAGRLPVGTPASLSGPPNSRSLVDCYRLSLRRHSGRPS